MKAYKKLLVMFLMAATALNYSCGKDDEVANPTLTIQQDKASAAPGEVVTFTVNASSDAAASLKTLKIEELVSGQTVGGVLKDSTVSGKNIVNYSFKYTVPTGATGTKSVKFTVTDNGSRTATKTQTVTVSGTAAPKTYNTTILGGQSNANVGSSFSTTDGIVYKVADAKSNSAKVDFIFYYGANNLATIAAPNDADVMTISAFQLSTWGTRNATKFKTSTSTAYDAATTTQGLEDAYSAGGSEMTAATQLKLGDAVAFKTQAGKTGIFKVTALDAKADGSITIDVKVQP